MVNFGPLAAEILSLVWGTPGNFNGFRVLAALLHGTLVVGASHTAETSGEILLFNNFFPIVDTCLSCEDIAGQSCGMVPRWRFLATFWVLHLQRAASSTFQTCIINSH